MSYYQRLLARDQDEAERLVLEQAKDSPPEAVFDGLLVPALSLAKRDRVTTRARGPSTGPRRSSSCSVT